MSWQCGPGVTSLGSLCRQQCAGRLACHLQPERLSLVRGARIWRKADAPGVARRCIYEDLVVRHLHVLRSPLGPTGSAAAPPAPAVHPAGSGEQVAGQPSGAEDGGLDPAAQPAESEQEQATEHPPGAREPAGELGAAAEEAVEDSGPIVIPDDSEEQAVDRPPGAHDPAGKLGPAAEEAGPIVIPDSSEEEEFVTPPEDEEHAGEVSAAADPASALA